MSKFSLKLPNTSAPKEETPAAEDSSPVSAADALDTAKIAEEANMEGTKIPKGKKSKKEKPKKTVMQEIMSWVWTLLAAVVIATAIRAFIAEPVRVDGDSMNNTLMDGEIVLVSKLDYLLGDLNRNDVIICRYPGRTQGSFHLGASLSLDSYTLFVKRLIALPGDTVEIKSGVLYVNDEIVPDPEKMASMPRDFAKVRLGSDQYFVVGDNRLISHDSRAGDVGPIKRDMIMGKVKCVFFPFNRIRSVE